MCAQALASQVRCIPYCETVQTDLHAPALQREEEEETRALDSRSLHPAGKIKLINEEQNPLYEAANDRASMSLDLVS